MESLNFEIEFFASAENDDFIVSFTSNRIVRRNSINNKVESEVSQYLLDGRTNIEILNEYKYIKAVFFKYNATLSSSAPVERVFCQTSMIFTPRRNRLSDDTFEKTVFFKHNKKLTESYSQSN